MRLRFDDFELDTERFELRRGGQPCRLEPKVFDLLALFARHPEQVFTRDELIERIWDGRVVSDATVSTCIKEARRALGDSGEAQTYIRTVRGRGFCFTANVTEKPAAGDARSAPRAAEAPGLAVAPSLAVLPFRALSETPDARELAASLTNDVRTILTRIPLLRVSAESLQAQGGVPSSARELHETLGVDFVLDATVQQRGGQFRINAQLTDARSGFQRWAEQVSVDGPLASALDAAVIAVVAKLEPQLHRAMHDAVSGAGGAPDARSLFLEASGIMALRGWHHDSFSAAADLLRRSWALEPEFALAPAYLSLVLGIGDRIGLMADREQAKAESLRAADRALALDGMDSTVLGYAGCALADIGFADRALPILRKAVEINPANAQAWAALGSVCYVQGRVDEGIEHLRRGMAMSPLDSRLSVWGAFLAMALLAANDADGALRQAELACQRDDGSYMARVILAAVHLARGEDHAAARAFEDARRIKPDLSQLQIASLVGERLGAALGRLRRAGRAAS